MLLNSVFVLQNKLNYNFVLFKGCEKNWTVSLVQVSLQDCGNALCGTGAEQAGVCVVNTGLHQG